MPHYDRNKIKIDKKKEMRTKEIAKMISEGGLGADKYYHIEKSYRPTNNPEDNKE